MKRAAQRVGWALMGYPCLVGYRRLMFKPPLWGNVYRLGVRISDWGHGYRP